MIEAQAVAFAIAALPQAGIKAASVAAPDIDTAPNGLRYDYLTVVYEVGATDTAHTVLKLQETETTGAGYADVPNATFAAALPGAGAGSTLYVFLIDLRYRQRYQKLVSTLGAGATGANVSAVAILSRSAESPVTNAQKGVAGQVYA